MAVVAGQVTEVWRLVAELSPCHVFVGSFRDEIDVELGLDLV